MQQLKASINGHVITNGIRLDLDQTQTKPSVVFDNNGYHTIIMVDPDAPYPKDPKYKYILHWMIINSNEEIVSYHPPSPPKDSAPHRYFIFLFRQKDYIEPGKIGSLERKKFNLSEFAQKYGLEDGASVYFVTGHNI